jgi:5'-methylthioadenosine phosphorylase
MPRERKCACATALQYAIITNPAAVPAETRGRLDLLVGKYLKKD